MNNHVKNQVETLMRLDTTYRNSDRQLVLKIWEDYGLRLNRVQRMTFFGVPSADSILRRRRELSAKYPASEAVTEHRYKHFKDHQEHYGKVTYPPNAVSEPKKSFLKRLFK